MASHPDTPSDRTNDGSQAPGDPGSGPDAEASFVRSEGVSGWEAISIFT